MADPKVGVPKNYERLTIDKLNDDAVYRMVTSIVKAIKYDFYRTYYAYRTLLEDRKGGRIVYQHQMEEAREAFHNAVNMFRSDIFEAALGLESNMSTGEYIRMMRDDARRLYDQDQNQYAITMMSYKEEHDA